MRKRDRHDKQKALYDTLMDRIKNGFKPEVDLFEDAEHVVRHVVAYGLLLDLLDEARPRARFELVKQRRFPFLCHGHSFPLISSIDLGRRGRRLTPPQSSSHHLADIAPKL